MFDTEPQDDLQCVRLLRLTSGTLSVGEEIGEAILAGLAKVVYTEKVLRETGTRTEFGSRNALLGSVEEARVAITIDPEICGSAGRRAPAIAGIEDPEVGVSGLARRCGRLGRDGRG